MESINNKDLNKGEKIAKDWFDAVVRRDAEAFKPKDSNEKENRSKKD